MKALIIGVSLLALTPSAWAMSDPAAKAPTAEKKEKKEADANRIICRRDRVIGSRLATKETCATAAEWAEMRAEQRRTTERVQTNRPKVSQ
ncbi:hypothetical protein [Sphingopyxis sp. SCN 67-31]|mgnify:FL=1|jgi:hypothetical protein|uniref:hypothetical protein n=1 Tax=Sphingopyxis sp. SCN 67-31 TaxID=1660142 RepID=UPI00257A719E|nr:hypothetical protein [Sphingopyxis sp. SCN 67-31]